MMIRLSRTIKVKVVTAEATQRGGASTANVWTLKSHIISVSASGLNSRENVCLLAQWISPKSNVHVSSHRNRMTHLWLSKLSNRRFRKWLDGLSPFRCQAIVKTTACLFLIWPQAWELLLARFQSKYKNVLYRKRPENRICKLASICLGLHMLTNLAVHLT